MRLKDEEVVVSFPYRLVPRLVNNMDKTIYAQKSHNEKTS